MPKYPPPVTQRFPRALADLTRKVKRLEHRMSGIDSGMPLALLPAVIDPSYTSGDPKANINGSANLTGPYKVIGPYVPVANDAVVVMPVPQTAVTAQAGSYVVLGKLGGNEAAQALSLLVGATTAGTSAALEVHTLIAVAGMAAPGTPPSGYAYIYVDASGLIHGKGPSGDDIILYANDQWNSMSTLGFVNGWTNGGRVPSQYRLTYSNETELVGSLTVPVGFAAGQTITTLPAAYRPKAGSTQSIPCRDLTNNATIWLQLGSGGALLYEGGVSAVVANDILDFHHFVPLDA